MKKPSICISISIHISISIYKRIYGRRMCTALAMRPSIRGRVHPSERWPLLKQGIVKQSSLD